MDPLAPYARWLPKKLVVLDQSLGKIESGSSVPSRRALSLACPARALIASSVPCAASYNLRIRSAEYTGSPQLLKAYAERLVSSGGGEDVVAGA